MTENSSSFTDLSLLPLNSSLNSSLEFKINPCFMFETSIIIFSTFSIINLLLLPLFILVLYLGYQQHSISTTGTGGASNLFIYHSITMQLTVFLGFTCFYCGGYFGLPEMMLVGFVAWSITTLGQGLFHILTCVERYLAVVQPITYLRLRQAGERRIRNISIACVWLLTFSWLLICYLTNSTVYFILYCFSTVSVFIVICFCSITVLCVLKRPGPGEVGRNKKRVDQSKQKAFITIFVIMGVHLFRFVGNLISNVIYSSNVLIPSNICVALLSTAWLDLPSSLVLPLLFLQRIGKLQCCNKKH